MRKIRYVMFTTFLMISSLWVVCFLWVHQFNSATVSYLFIAVWLSFTGFVFYIGQYHVAARHYTNVIYIILFIIMLMVFFSMKPSNDREWRPENRELMDFHFVNGQVEINNVRNFIWESPDQYTVQWETRRYALEDIKSVDLIVSHFIKGPIAHVFISFGFENGQYLSFSLEVRQEMDEDFSLLGGFFRQYELALVVGDENDLIYSRTNIRNEDVYIYPLKMDKIAMQMLFLEYLNKANRLRHHPRWYNTLLSNCTTILFDLSEYALGQIPRDYRVIFPGLLPNYLYDHQNLSNKMSPEEWRERAFINPKVKQFTHGPDDARDFSRIIREDMISKEHL